MEDWQKIELILANKKKKKKVGGALKKKSKSAQDHYNKIINWYKDNWLFSKKYKNWNKLLNKFDSKKLKTIPQTDKFISNLIFNTLNKIDKHSYYVKDIPLKDVKKVSKKTHLPTSHTITHRKTGKQVLLYIIPPFMHQSLGVKAGHDYREAILWGFAEHPKITLFLVDLRGNFGGENIMNEGFMSIISRRPVKKIAVVVDRNTASAAEWFVMDIKDKFKNKCKIFGERTYGVLTDTRATNFSPNYLATTTVNYYTSPSGKKYKKGWIDPDIKLKKMNDPDPAADWLFK